MAGMLYLVPTPIGNLGDISKRARETLESADFIAAEDTRVTLKLLNHLELKKPLVSYYEHNKSFKGEKILDRILAGETCALVSDAGSPAISDPGEDLVKQCAAAGIPVCAIPGPCAAITALSISAQSTGRFCFEGFLSTAKKSRREHLDSLKKEQRTMIFYEAPHKLRTTLDDLTAAFGADRSITLCRELTKLHEEIWKTTLGEAVEHYRAAEPRGEYVLVMAGTPAAEPTELTLDEAAQRALELTRNGYAASAAAKAAATPPAEVAFDLSSYPGKISTLAALKGTGGFLLLDKMTVNAFEADGFLLLTGFTDAGAMVPPEDLEKLFKLPQTMGAAVALPSAVTEKLAVNARLLADATLRKSLEANNTLFKERLGQLDRWVEDQVSVAEHALAAVKAELRAARHEQDVAANQEELAAAAARVEALERKKRRARRQIDEAEEKADADRQKIIVALKAKMVQKVTRETLFTIRWKVI